MLIWKEPSGRSESARCIRDRDEHLQQECDFKIILKFDSLWKEVKLGVGKNIIKRYIAVWNVSLHL